MLCLLCGWNTLKDPQGSFVRVVWLKCSALRPVCHCMLTEWPNTAAHEDARIAGRMWPDLRTEDNMNVGYAMI
jgi:hypothetical protein